MIDMHNHCISDMHTGQIMNAPFFNYHQKRPGAIYISVYRINAKMCVGKIQVFGPLAYKRKNYNTFLPVYRKIKPIY